MTSRTCDSFYAQSLAGLLGVYQISIVKHNRCRYQMSLLYNMHYSSDLDDNWLFRYATFLTWVGVIVNKGLRLFLDLHVDIFNVI